MQPSIYFANYRLLNDGSKEKANVKKGAKMVEESKNGSYKSPIEKKGWKKAGLFDFTKPKKSK